MIQTRFKKTSSIGFQKHLKNESRLWKSSGDNTMEIQKDFKELLELFVKNKKAVGRKKDQADLEAFGL